MTQYKFKNLLFILPVLFLVFVAVYYYLDKTTLVIYGKMDNYVEIDGIPVAVMIADELQEQWQGLSDREFLGSQNGMLFVFDSSQERTFVMRRMKFPLDIIWIDNDKIVKIDKRLPPEGERPEVKYHSDREVNYVLEVNGGYADAHGVKVGDRVMIQVSDD